MNDEKILQMALFVMANAKDIRKSHQRIKELAEETVVFYVLKRDPTLMDNLTELTKEVNKMLTDNCLSCLTEDGVLDVDFSKDEIVYTLSDNVPTWAIPE